MDPEQLWNVVANPAWRPLTNTDLPGFAVLAICAAVLIGLTLWTYLGSSQTTPRRLFLLIVLRLLALTIAILTALRPAISVTEQPKQKSILVIALDSSESMTVTDEYDKLSRWEVLKRNVEKCEPLLKQLQDEQEVTVHLYPFSTDFNLANDQYRPPGDDKKELLIADWIRSKKPDGKRTDFGQMLAELHKKYLAETLPFRGLVIVSDGGNNVMLPDLDPIRQAGFWRYANRPIYAFMTGRSETRTDQKDIGFTSIVADPSPVGVKADLTVKATLKASGLENANVKIKLSISIRNGETRKWEDVPELARIETFRLTKPAGNEIELATKATEKPGQIRATLEIVEGPAEDRIQGNNRISTFVTVTKEGVRVLVIDRARLELKFLREALGSDKRFDLVQLIRQTDDPLPAGEARKFDLLNEAYDVIILGDVSPERLNRIDPKLMENIAKLVGEKGVGLLMTGGVDSFGGTPGQSGNESWKNTPLAELLPVEIPDRTLQRDGPTQIVPLANAFSEYIMKLQTDPDANRKTWEKLGDTALSRLGGYTEIGKPKRGAKVYALARETEKGGEAPLLVGQTLGRSNARVLAFGADQTWKWMNLGSQEKAEDPDEGIKLHSRFWRQMVLWLAHQDEVEGSVFVRPQLSRLAVNGRNDIDMGIKGKHNDEVLNPKMRYQVIPAGEEPDEKKARPAERGERGKPRGRFEARLPGEYRVIARGEGKDVDGTEIKGDAEAWFDVYPEVSDELLNPAANESFLLELEKAARSSTPEYVRKVDKLPAFLKEEFIDKPLKQPNLRPKLYPDWRRDGDSRWFLPILLVAFVAILSLEWGLRRVWGMV